MVQVHQNSFGKFSKIPSGSGAQELATAAGPRASSGEDSDDGTADVVLKSKTRPSTAGFSLDSTSPA